MDRYYLREIKSLFSSCEYPPSDAEDLLMYILKVSYTDLYTGNLQLESDQVNELKQMIDRRLKGEPIAYIVGYKEFLSSHFKVTSDTLIPRPETEILVNEIIKRIKEKNIEQVRILEIGTGTGCIIISIIKELQNESISISGVAIDISERALEIARYNGKALEVSDKIEFINCDLKDFNQNDFNIVVSNPPYIPSNDIFSLETSVKDYEPQIALDGGSDGLEFYREIGKLVDKINNCILGVEFGIGQSNEILKIFDKFKEKRVINDLSNIERVIICEKF